MPIAMAVPGGGDGPNGWSAWAVAEQATAAESRIEARRVRIAK
jgi:hypothetical protein